MEVKDILYEAVFSIYEPESAAILFHQYYAYLTSEYYLTIEDLSLNLFHRQQHINLPPELKRKISHLIWEKTQTGSTIDSKIRKYLAENSAAERRQITATEGSSSTRSRSQQQKKQENGQMDRLLSSKRFEQQQQHEESPVRTSQGMSHQSPSRSHSQSAPTKQLASPHSEHVAAKTIVLTDTLDLCYESDSSGSGNYDDDVTIDISAQVFQEEAIQQQTIQQQQQQPPSDSATPQREEVTPAALQAERVQAAIDSSWKTYMSDEGYPYHFNSITQESSWDCPLGLYLDRDDQDRHQREDEDEYYRECECFATLSSNRSRTEVPFIYTNEERCDTEGSCDEEDGNRSTNTTEWNDLHDDASTISYESKTDHDDFEFLKHEDDQKANNRGKTPHQISGEINEKMIELFESLELMPNDDNDDKDDNTNSTLASGPMNQCNSNSKDNVTTHDPKELYSSVSSRPLALESPPSSPKITQRKRKEEAMLKAVEQSGQSEEELEGLNQQPCHEKHDGKLPDNNSSNLETRCLKDFLDDSKENTGDCSEVLSREAKSELVLREDVPDDKRTAILNVLVNNLSVQEGDGVNTNEASPSSSETGDKLVELPMSGPMSGPDCSLDAGSSDNSENPSQPSSSATRPLNSQSDQHRAVCQESADDKSHAPPLVESAAVCSLPPTTDNDESCTSSSQCNRAGDASTVEGSSSLGHAYLYDFDENSEKSSHHSVSELAETENVVLAPPSNAAEDISSTLAIPSFTAGSHFENDRSTEKIKSELDSPEHLSGRQKKGQLNYSETPVKEVVGRSTGDEPAHSYDDETDPNNWEVCFTDDEDIPYHFNFITGTSVWDCPHDLFLDSSKYNRGRYRECECVKMARLARTPAWGEGGRGSEREEDSPARYTRGRGGYDSEGSSDNTDISYIPPLRNKYEDREHNDFNMHKTSSLRSDREISELRKENDNNYHDSFKTKSNTKEQKQEAEEVWTRKNQTLIVHDDEQTAAASVFIQQRDMMDKDQKVSKTVDFTAKESDAREEEVVRELSKPAKKVSKWKSLKKMLF
jgi:hypothetical protein